MVEHEGRETLILRAESVNQSSTLDVLFDYDTYEMQKVFRDGKTFWDRKVADNDA